MRFMSAAILFAFTLALLCQPVLAQSELSDSEKAAVMFDFDIARMQENSVVQALGIADMVRRGANLPPGMSESLDLERVNRIYGGVQPPADMSQLQAMDKSDPLPINFFVRIEFVDSAAAESLWSQLNREDSGRHEFGGKEYLSPPNGDTPNIRAHKPDERTVEIGTDRYLYRSDRKVFGGGVMEQWSKLPEAGGVRIAVDIAAAQELVDQGLDIARRQAPPEAFGIIELATKLGAVALFVDLDSEHLLKLIAVGRDEQAAEDLESGINGLLGLVKMQTGGMVEGLDAQSREIVQPIMDALKTRREGTDVVLEIPKPEGFDEFVSVMARQARAQAQEMQEMNRLRQFAVAAHNYYDVYKQFPFHPTGEQSGDLSWRVRVLPFLEQGQLANQMDLASGWDAEVNKAHLDNMPEIFGPRGHLTNVAWVVSPVRKFADITDGTSNTVMLILLPEPSIPWTRNEDLTLDQAAALLQNATPEKPVIVALYDGSVQKLNGSMSDEAYRAILTPDGGEVVPR